MSLIFGNSGPYVYITRYVSERGISYLKLFPGLDILSHTLRVSYLLPSLEKQKTKPVSIAEGGSCYEGRCSILMEAGHLCSYRKGNYSQFTDTENGPKYTIRYSEPFRT